MSKEEINGRKNLKRMLKVVLAFILIMIFIFSPDILFWIRHVVKKIPIVNNFARSNISDKEYVQIMIVAFTNCAAVSVSIMAYFVAKTVSKAQIEPHEQGIIVAATMMINSFKKNSKIIFDTKKGTGNTNELIISDDLLKNGILLFSAKKITAEERDTWLSYFRKVTSITKYHEAGNVKEENEKINEYFQKFFEEDSETMEYKESIQALIHSLEKIAEGE